MTRYEYNKEQAAECTIRAVISSVAGDSRLRNFYHNAAKGFRLRNLTMSVKEAEEEVSDELHR